MKGLKFTVVGYLAEGLKIHLLPHLITGIPSAAGLTAVAMEDVSMVTNHSGDSTQSPVGTEEKMNSDIKEHTIRYKGDSGGWDQWDMFVFFFLSQQVQQAVSRQPLMDRGCTIVTCTGPSSLGVRKLRKLSSWWQRRTLTCDVRCCRDGGARAIDWFH